MKKTILEYALLALSYLLLILSVPAELASARKVLGKETEEIKNETMSSLKINYLTSTSDRINPKRALSDATGSSERNDLIISLPVVAQDLYDFSMDFCMYINQSIPYNTFTIIQAGGYTLFYNGTSDSLGIGHTTHILYPYPPLKLEAFSWYHVALTFSYYSSTQFSFEIVLTSDIQKQIGKGKIDLIRKWDTICIPKSSSCHSSYAQVNILYEDLRVWNGSFNFLARDLSFRKIDVEGPGLLYTKRFDRSSPIFKSFPLKKPLSYNCPSLYCLICLDPLTCYFCQSGYYFYQHTCVPACERNTYPNTGLLECKKCPEDCSKCAEVVGEPVPRCTSCEIMYKPVLLNGRCYHCENEEVNGKFYYNGTAKRLVELPTVKIVQDKGYGLVKGKRAFLRIAAENKALLIKCKWNAGQAFNATDTTLDLLMNMHESKLDVTATCDIVAKGHEQLYCNTKALFATGTFNVYNPLRSCKAVFDFKNREFTLSLTGLNQTIKAWGGILDIKTGAYIRMKELKGNSSIREASNIKVDKKLTEIQVLCEVEEPYNNILLAEDGYRVFKEYTSIEEITKEGLENTTSLVSIHKYTGKLFKLSSVEREHSFLINRYKEIIEKLEQIIGEEALKKDEEQLVINVLLYITFHNYLLSADIVERVYKVIEKVKHLGRMQTMLIEAQIKILNRLMRYSEYNDLTNNLKRILTQKLFWYTWYNGDFEYRLDQNIYCTKVGDYGRTAYSCGENISVQFEDFPYLQSTVILTYRPELLNKKASIGPISSVSISIFQGKSEVEALSSSLMITMPSPFTIIETIFDPPFPNQTALIQNDIFTCAAELSSDACQTTWLKSSSHTLICKCKTRSKVTVLFNQARYHELVAEIEIPIIIDIRRMGVLLLVLGMVSFYVLAMLYLKSMNKDKKLITIQEQLRKEMAPRNKEQCPSALVPVVQNKYLERDESKTVEINGSFSEQPIKIHAEGFQQQENLMHWQSFTAKARVFWSKFFTYFAKDFICNNLMVQAGAILLHDANHSRNRNLLIGVNQLIITLWWNEIIIILTASSASAEFIEAAPASWMLLAGFTTALIPSILTILVALLWNIPETIKARIYQSSEENILKEWEEAKKNLKCRTLLGWSIVIFCSGIGGMYTIIWGFATKVDTIYLMLKIFGIALMYNGIAMEVLGSATVSLLYAGEEHSSFIGKVFAFTEGYRMHRVLY